MSGDDSLPGSAAPGSVQQPGLGLVGLQSGELQLIEEGQQRQAEAGDPSGPLTRQALDQARASASANNSPQPAKPAADESEDVETQPPQMSDLSAFHAGLQAAHDAAEAQRRQARGTRPPCPSSCAPRRASCAPGAPPPPCASARGASRAPPSSPWRRSFRFP